jgi:hypothetical protein
VPTSKDEGAVTHGGNDGPSQTPPALATDTLADKGLRFGCGAAIGVIVALTLAMFGDGFPTGAGLAFVALAVAVCGALAVKRGDTFVESLLKALNWFW